MYQLGGTLEVIAGTASRGNLCRRRSGGGERRLGRRLRGPSPGQAEGEAAEVVAAEPISALKEVAAGNGGNAGNGGSGAGRRPTVDQVALAVTAALPQAARFSLAQDWRRFQART